MRMFWVTYLTLTEVKIIRHLLFFGEKHDVYDTVIKNNNQQLNKSQFIIKSELETLEII